MVSSIVRNRLLEVRTGERQFETCHQEGNRLVKRLGVGEIGHGGAEDEQKNAVSEEDLSMSR